MMAQARSVALRGQSLPPNSRSVSAKRQSRTSSRITRSRSRELADSPAPAPLSFKVPSVPQKSDDATRQKYVLRTPRTSDASSRGNGLSPIKEHRANDARHGLEFSPGHQSNISQTYVAESQTDHGNISGTTMLQTDDSEHEFDELDPHLILDTLPDLLNASNKALDLLAPPGLSYVNISRHFQTSKFAVRLNRIKVTFETQKKCMGKANFIPVERSVAALSSIKRLNWKSQGLYQKANLAQLALDLVNPHLTTSTAVADDNFPIAFIDSLPSGLAPSEEGNFKRETVRLGLELRTQRFIASLQSDTRSQSSGPEELLEDVFYNPSLGDNDSRLKGWTMDGLEDDEHQLPEEFQGIVQERIAQIRRSLARKGGLEAEFPWSDFVIDIANWIRRRANDIDQQLSSQMPVEEAIKILQAELDKRSSFGPGNPLEPILDPLLDEVESPVERNTTPERAVEAGKDDGENPETVTSPTARPHRRFRGKGAPQHILAVEPVEEAPPISAQAPPAEVNNEPQAPASPAPRPRRRFQGKGALRRIIVAGSADEVPSSSSLSPATENRTLSPDQGTEAPSTMSGPRKDSLVNVEESPMSPPQNPAPRPTPGISTQKSPQKNGSSNRPEEELPPLSSAEIWKLSEEGKKMTEAKQQNKPRAAFIDRQDDARRVSPISFTSSPRPTAPPAASPQKRTVGEALDQDDDESEESDELESDSRPSKRRRVAKTPGPPRPTPAAGSSMGSTSSNRPVARTNSAPAIAPPPRQFEQVVVENQPLGLNWCPRRAWSLEEEARLRELIEECGGPAWSEIKKRDSMAGDILFRRTQVQIKDKGAQMHFDDLLTGRPVSDAMSGVPIKANMRERLIKAGRLKP